MLTGQLPLHRFLVNLVRPTKYLSCSLAMSCDSRFRQASLGASLRYTISRVIYLQLLVSAIQAACAFRNLTGSTLLRPRTSAPTLSPSPSAAVNSASKLPALAWYITRRLHVNQLAALSNSNTVISNFMGVCTCCTAAELAAASSGGLFAVCCTCWVST